MNNDALFGLTTTHLSSWIDTRVTPIKTWAMHRDAIDSWNAMLVAAASDGVIISPLSSFRDFARQRLIWNEKFNGQRRVHDEQNRTLIKSDFDDWAWVKKILRYSALPGLSRHHWGSDIDVFDGAALQQGALPQLQASEFCADGPCAQLDAWLQQRAHDFGFCRPYCSAANGVAPEPWHLSYIAIARQALAELNPEQLHALLRNNDIAGIDIILPRLDQIIRRYALAVDPMP